MSNESSQSALLSKIAAYTDILSKDPQSTVFVSLAEAYRKLGHLEDARRIVEQGLQTHADFSPAHVIRARILCQQTDYQGSRAAFNRAIELDNSNLAALVGCARLEILSGQEDQARTLLLQARDLSPADPVINKLLNSLPPQPVKAVQPEPDAPADIEQNGSFTAPLISETLADLYLQQGVPDKALEILRELLRNDPDNLKLRRKVREAEEAGAESSAAVAHEQTGQIHTDAAEEAEEPIMSDMADNAAVLFSDEAENGDKEEPPADVPPVVATSNDPLTRLNQWLINIERRRAHV